MIARTLSLTGMAVVGLLAAAPSANACACCSNVGQRVVETVALESGRRDLIRGLHFAKEATLFLGEGDGDSITGIANPSSLYALTAQWQDDRLVLHFSDPLGHNGTLALTLPSQISLFEIDPREPVPREAMGPLLYKEWSIHSPAAGSGVFATGLGPQQRLTLILHGRGNSCSSDRDFRHWTLVMDGPAAHYSLFGDLLPVP